MCCGDDEVLDLPPPVIEMVARYRRLREEQGWGWGEEALPDFFRWARFALLGPAFDEFATSGDWGAAVRAAIGDDVPAGLVVVAIDADGHLTARTGRPRPLLAGSPVPVDVVLDSSAAEDLDVTVGGTPVPVPAGGAGLHTVDVDAAGAEIEVRSGAARVVVRVGVATPGATLRLTSPAGARWSVTDATGGAWFPAGVPRKWDATGLPFFHAGRVDLAVPAGPLSVTAARGIEWERLEVEVQPEAGALTEVGYRPARRFDPGAGGWHGADLHVHLNYSGDLVLAPEDAARMQRGEGLELLHLTAGNLGGALVYDRELLESTVGTDLPWSGDGVLARAGLEFRNDLLGHVHGLGLTGVPGTLHTGHEGSDAPWDWPPNSVACAAMQQLGATTTYAHPVLAPDVDDLFAATRSVEARELVADAALGVVDGLELLSVFDDRGAVDLYHRLLSCGLRLAALAGTDVFLSFARGPGTASNPPGWATVYARTEGPLTVASFQAAVRAGRTVVTDGPWLTLSVAGEEPGAVLDVEPGTLLPVRAAVVGSGVERLVLHGPDGELAGTGGEELRHDLRVGDDGLWIAAAAYGADDPHTPGAPVFAHTTPVWVDVAGRRVVRAGAARWCLGALDALQDLVTAEGRFDPARREEQLGDLVAVLDRARAVYREALARAGG